MAEWIGGLLSGLPAWLIVIISIIIFIIGAIWILAFDPVTAGGDPVLPFKGGKMMKNKKAEDLEKEIAELTSDLQRTRADFENYRKRVEAEKQSAHQMGQTKSVMKLLPVIDTIERAVANVPEELRDKCVG